MFRIWIGNLGKYNEGILEGEWVDLPCWDFDEVFERIGINDEYEEYFIADFENDYGYDVGEYDSPYMLNEVAETLEGLTDDECEIWEALHDDGWNHDEIMPIIEQGDYVWYSDCVNMSDVAYSLYEMSGQLAEIDKIMPTYYVDWDAIGRDLSLEGSFHSCDSGYFEILR